MLIIPAIDIRGGKCVRLFQGDYSQETVYGEDPAAMAGKVEGATMSGQADMGGVTTVDWTAKKK
jgi:phosphoribosylformimino-5-aminoimidazole carboxamide ribotide isomerase